MAKKVKSDKTKGKNHKILSEHTLERTVGGATASSAVSSGTGSGAKVSATMPSTATASTPPRRR